MHKFKILAFLISLSLLIYSCRDNAGNFKREVSNINSQVFYGIDSGEHTNKELLKLITLGINKAFGLKNIKESPAENELRVYCLFSFGEIFFRQEFINGNANLELFICRTIKKGDSLFMNIKTEIKSKGKYPYDSSLNVNFLSDSLTIDYTNKEEDVLDGVDQYVIQIKNNALNKYILIHRPFEFKDMDVNTKYIYNLLRNIMANFSFKFHDPWEKIVDSAFGNPYHLNKN